MKYNWHCWCYYVYCCSLLTNMQSTEHKSHQHKKAIAVDITVTLYHRHYTALSQVNRSIKAIHVINSRVLSLNVLHAGNGDCRRQRHVKSASCLHDVRLIASVSLWHRHGGVLQWSRRGCGHVHHTTAVAVLVHINNVILYSQLTQTWSCWLTTRCNSSNSCNYDSTTSQAATGLTNN